MERTAQRILLREFSRSDVNALTAVRSDPRVSLYCALDVGTLERTQMLVDAELIGLNGGAALGDHVDSS
jgi:hypothetical protein